MEKLVFSKAVKQRLEVAISSGNRNEFFAIYNGILAPDNKEEIFKKFPKEQAEVVWKEEVEWDLASKQEFFEYINSDKVLPAVLKFY